MKTIPDICAVTRKGPPVYIYTPSLPVCWILMKTNKKYIHGWGGEGLSLSLISLPYCIPESNWTSSCYWLFDASPHSSTTRSAKCPRAHSIFNYILFPSNIILFLIGMATRPDDKERDLYICCCVLYSWKSFRSMLLDAAAYSSIVLYDRRKIRERETLIQIINYWVDGTTSIGGRSLFIFARRLDQ